MIFTDGSVDLEAKFPATFSYVSYFPKAEAFGTNLAHQVAQEDDLASGSREARR